MLWRPRATPLGMVPGIHAGGVFSRDVRQGMVMSQSDQPPLFYPTRIDIPLEIRAYLITLLNQTLACTVDLRFQVKHAAWNVKGNVFFQLRALFEAIVIELDAHMDLVAERITVLGGDSAGHGPYRSHAVDAAGVSRRSRGRRRPCVGPGGALSVLRHGDTGRY